MKLRGSSLLYVLLLPLLISMMVGCARPSEVIRLETELTLLQEQITLLQIEQDRLKRSYAALRRNYVRNIETVGSRLVETSQTAEGATVRVNGVDRRVDELAESVLDMEIRYEGRR